MNRDQKDNSKALSAKQTGLDAAKLYNVIKFFLDVIECKAKDGFLCSCTLECVKVGAHKWQSFCYFTVYIKNY